MRIETCGGIHDIDKRWTVIAGPCSAESKDQILTSARFAKDAGAHVLRAGLWKPRTHASSWQGCREEAIEWMTEAKRETGMAITTEVNDRDSVRLTLRAGFDILWIGSRSGMHYPLLEVVGVETKGSGIPIILKRNMGADLDDWLGAAEYILRFNQNVILCERGIKGFPKDTRNVLDLQTAKLAQKQSGLPVIIDVSHASGRADLIVPMSLAVKAAGFNGLMIEVHPDPQSAMTDGKQQISFADLKILMEKLSKIPQL